MKLLTVTNLYPRPDQPNRGLFNAELFLALATAGCSVAPRENHVRTSSFRNVCLVPEWRLWRWRRIRAWTDPFTSLLSTTYVPAFYLPVLGRSASWFTYARALGRVEMLWQDCTAVLATWLYPDAVAAAALTTRNGTDLWIKVHGTDRFHLRNNVRRRRILAAGAASKGIVCNCRFMAEQLAVLGLPRAKLHVIPNGVDTTRFRYRAREEAANELPQALQAASDGTRRRLLLLLEDLLQHRIVLFVGNLVRIKGPDILLAAAGLLREPRVRVAFIGTGPFRDTLRAAAQRSGVAGRVHFLGERPHDEVALWMNVADVLAVPSRSEGMPNVVLEALTAGLPVVATDVGGSRETLADEVACRLVTAENPPALAAALEEILDLAPDRAALAARHAGRWSWATSAENLLALMKAA